MENPRKPQEHDGLMGFFWDYTCGKLTVCIIEHGPIDTCDLPKDGDSPELCQSVYQRAIWK